MRQAKRIFSKSNLSAQQSLSPVFRSKIQRDLPNDSKNSYLGPGQYNVCLPIVKPKIEAIRKNNNTIIIKVNQKLSPVFQSIQPRFKQQSQKRSHSVSIQHPQIYGFMPKRSQRSNNNQKKVAIGMKNRLQKLSQIFKNPINYEDTIDANSNDKIKKLSYEDCNEQIVNSIKLYKKQKQRLHFLLKNMKNKKLTKGPSWSKYRQTKGNLYSINNVPGPGSYDQHSFIIQTQRYMQTIDDKSWQFKSLTKRNSFGRLNEEKTYEIYKRNANEITKQIGNRMYRVDSIPLINKQENRIQFIQQL